MKEQPPLQNLFMYLVREGFPLGVRDYEDALKALSLGYGLNSREDLLRLCKTLWVRNEDEKRFLDSLFSQFLPPTDEEIKKIIKDKDSPSAKNPEPPKPSGKPAGSDEPKPQPVPEFTPSTNQRGIGLPGAKITPKEDEYFILSPRLLISVRRLTVIWRRYRVAKREGPKTELDLKATIEEKCRHGIIGEPVFVSAHRNQARLVIIIDVSASMIAWQSFNNVLLESLKRGQLGEAKVYYFHNVPGDVLYEKETLIKPKAIAGVLKQNQNNTLMIISDCGAARGYQNKERAAATQKFLEEVSRFWYPVVWLNPMPPGRWENTTAESVNQLLNNKMFQLSEDGLIKAIDVLRGKRAR